MPLQAPKTSTRTSGSWSISCEPDPFQALYRTTSMGAAARWMQEHGTPPLACGVRNTGEQAMLASPSDACGAYFGFVGPK